MPEDGLYNYYCIPDSAMRIDVSFINYEKFLGDGTPLKMTPLVTLKYKHWDYVSLVLYKYSGSAEIVLHGIHSDGSFLCMCESLN